MAYRLVLVWFALLALAILNGGFRETVLLPALGRDPAQAVSTVMLSTLILAVTWLTLPWLAPASTHDAWRIGAVWLLLTVAFEFIAGHYLFGRAWDVLLADYNVMAGRIWVLVLAVTLLAPVLVFMQREGAMVR